MQGKTINGFELQHKLGEGGMAEVWYAENKIGMKAAVKILNAGISGRKQLVERFLNEAKIMVTLDHPNIRRAYDYGEIDGRPTIIQEFLEGNDLEKLINDGCKFSDDLLIKWWNQLVAALKHTHSMGIVHRDIKPSNIFIDKYGNVKLMDFGIAKIVEDDSLTKTGTALGTRLYMSPEQVKDPKRVGPKSDNYSLAVTFIHLLVGSVPYDTTTSSDFDIMLQIVSKPLDMNGVPQNWRNFLMPYLEKDPDKRAELMPFCSVEEQTGCDIQPSQAYEQKTANGLDCSKNISKTVANVSDLTKTQVIDEPIQTVKTEPVSTQGECTDSGKTKFSKIMKIGLIAAGVSLVLLIVLLVVLLPNKEDVKTYNGKNAIEYLEQAKLLVNNSDYESLNSAWEYFHIADSLEDGSADVSVLLDIINKANSLFNDKIAKGKLTEEETDTAAMFITLSRKIYDMKNEAIMAKVSNDDSASIDNINVEYYIQHFETLSDMYFKQAESAERIWTKHRDDVKEEKLLKYSIQQALLYNPDNEGAKIYKEKYCD